MANFEIGPEDKQEEKLPYVPPAIVYEGLVTARAGSLGPEVPPFQDDEAGVQPVDLFGGGNG